MMLIHLVRLMLLRSLSVGTRGSLWEIIIKELGKELALIFSLVLFFVNLLVLAVVLYLAGLIVVGEKRALLTDAFIISLIGTILSTVFFMFIPYHLVALFLCIIVWLLLIKRLYETGWLGSITVGILAIIIFLAITVLLALIFGIFYIIFELSPMISIF